MELEAKLDFVSEMEQSCDPHTVEVEAGGSGYVTSGYQSATHETLKPSTNP